MAAAEGGRAVLHVEVVYALPREQALVRLELPQGSTLEAAVVASGLLLRYPELGSAALALGVHGEPRAANVQLHDGDRVELYRPLRADPKLTRRRRAATS